MKVYQLTTLPLNLAMSIFLVFQLWTLFTNDKVLIVGTNQIGPITMMVLFLLEVYYIIVHIQLVLVLWFRGEHLLEVLPPKDEKGDKIFATVYLICFNCFITYFIFFSQDKLSIQEFIILFLLNVYILNQRDFFLYIFQIYFIQRNIRQLRSLQATKLESAHRMLGRLFQGTKVFNRRQGLLLFFQQSMFQLSTVAIVLFSFFAQSRTMYYSMAFFLSSSLLVLQTVVYATNTFMAWLYGDLQAKLSSKACKSKRQTSTTTRIRVDRLLVEGSLDRQLCLWFYRLFPLTLNVLGDLLNYSFNLSIVLYQSDTM